MADFNKDNNKRLRDIENKLVITSREREGESWAGGKGYYGIIWNHVCETFENYKNTTEFKESVIIKRLKIVPSPF